MKIDDKNMISAYLNSILLQLLFKRFYLFLERKEGKEKERERNINVWLPLARPPLGDLTCNPSMCPDWESNL